MVDVERAFLKSLIYSSENFNLLSNISPEKFSSIERMKVFSYLIMQFSEGKTIDFVLVKSAFEKIKNVVEEIDKISEAEFVPSLFEEYQESLDEALLKKHVLESFLNSIDRIGKAKQGEIRGVVDGAEGELFGIIQKGEQSDRLQPIGEVGADVMAVIKRVREEGVPPYVCVTGFSDIDNIVGGFSGGDFIILAGRPSQGKTAFAVQLMRNIIENNAAAGFLSLEMSSDQIFLRLLSSESGMNSLRIKSGQITKGEQDQLFSVWQRIKDMPMYIDDTPFMNEVKLRSKARRMLAKYNIKVLVIDYIQLMEASKYSENRQQEISKISRSIKGLAKELNIPVVALSQLSRKTEERENKRPQMSDLRESGSLEQDADMIMFMYRPEQYGIPYFEDETPTTGMVEIIISKARNAPTGSVRLVFKKEKGTFYSLAKEADFQLDIQEEHPEHY